MADSNHLDAAPAVPALVRELCPSCLGPGGECDRCNGSGYVLVSPYAEGRGEQGEDYGHSPFRAVRVAQSLEQALLKIIVRWR